jgi:hypothetical protein
VFMEKVPHSFLRRLMFAGLCVPLAAGFSAAQTSIRQVKVLGDKSAVEIEVQASERLVPKTQVLTNPDRLIVDFPGAIPGAQLRGQSVGRGEVKDVRVSLEQAKPPLTRLVLNLKSAQSFQVFPYGRTLIIKVSNARVASAKVTGGARDLSTEFDDFTPAPPTRPGLVVANYTAAGERVSSEPQVKPLEVFFRDGLLRIKANKANLSEVLFAVQQQTGAQVAIVAGAEQEQVVGDIGPASAPEVLASLLNGSKFNYLIVSAANDPRKLEQVILTPKPSGPMPPPPPHHEEDDDDVAPPPPTVQTPPQHNLQPQPSVPIQAGIPVPTGQATDARPGEAKPATDDNTPDQ